jgi:hypothetical protein
VGVGDFNSDGKPDILWRHTPSGMNYVWYMNGTSIIGGGNLPTVDDMNWAIVATGDFNSDVYPDILWRHTPSGENYVWYMNGTSIIGGGNLPTVNDMSWTIVKQ